MSRTKGRLVRWGIYCCFAVALLTVLAYVRFPAEQFRQYCERRAETLFAGIQCRVGSVSYLFPLGLRLGNILFTSTKFEDDKAEAVTLEKLDIYFSPANPGWEYRLAGEIYSGTFSGILKKGKKPGAFTLADIEIRNVDLQKIVPLQLTLNRKIQGLLDYSGTYAAEVNKYSTGILNGKVRLNQGGIALRQKLLELETIDVQEMAADLETTGKNLQVKNGRMRGKDVSCDFTATVAVAAPWMLSNITMTGDLAVQQEYLRAHPGIAGEVNALRRISQKQTIHFSVRGSLQSPVMTLGY